MLSSSYTSSPATIRVEKATSDLLIGPDWALNMDICDSINAYSWEAKDAVKAAKKRLQHKNPKVQLLALTLLETMVKNCGEHVHFQIVERNILQEMLKIVKKKFLQTDLNVREKILVLLDSWQEAFGGPRGKYPQYFWAYEELRHAGVVFPQRSPDAAPIFTPPVTHSTLSHAQASYKTPINSSTRLDEAMAADMENLSLSSINFMRSVLDLLADMLQAVNPSDHVSVKDEVIVDLVNQCRSNQKRLMKMLTTTGDEEFLGQGLELNDRLQNVLAKHDAIASGSPLLIQFNSNLKPTEVVEPSQTPNANPSSLVVTGIAATKGKVEEDEEDDFAQLVQRHSKTRPTSSQDGSTCSSEVTSANASNDSILSIAASSAPVPSNALAVTDPPAPARATKEKDLIDFLSITLSTTSASPQPPQAPAASSQNIHQAPTSPTTQGYQHASQAYPGNQGQVPFNQGQVPFNSYVVPWAQPQLQAQLQPQTQPQYPQYLSSYPPPPWAPTPGYFSSQNYLSTAPNMFSTPGANTTASHTSMQGARSLQNINAFPATGSNESPMNGEPRVSYGPRTTTSFVPSYRLFEDLNVLGNGDARFNMTTSTSTFSGQSMVGGRK